MKKNTTTTQKEMNETFIATIESIEGVCNRITSGNVSHHISTIKGKCRAMLQFYKEIPVTPWHSVADGDLPLSYVDCLFSYGEGLIRKGYMLDNQLVILEGETNPMPDIEDVEYWMEIPSIPEYEK